MSLILNIETSSDICSVAVGRNREVMEMLEAHESRDHARVLTLLVDKILKKNSLRAGDLDAVAISKGPGSYTGLRIGVSAAKGLAFGLKIPLIAISTLEAMVLGVLSGLKEKISGLPDNIWLCPMIDARRMEVYLSFYDLKGKQQTGVRAAVITPGVFNDILKERELVFFGTGSEKCRVMIKGPNVHFLEGVTPAAASMVPLSFERFKNQEFEDVAYFEPFYLKEFVATIPKNKWNMARKLRRKL